LRSRGAVERRAEGMMWKGEKGRVGTGRSERVGEWESGRRLSRGGCVLQLGFLI